MDLETKRRAVVTARWIVVAAAAVVLGVVLALPLGLSLVALMPPFLLLVACGAAYLAWRNHAMRRGLEPDARGGDTELVGGREARDPEARASRT